MPTRTAYTYSAASGDVLTAANVQKIPGGLVGYVSNATDYTLNATTDTTICSLSLTLQERVYIVQAFCCYSYSDDYSTRAYLEIYDSVDGTIQLSDMTPYTPGPNLSPISSLCVRKITTADTSARTLTMRARGGNNGTHKIDSSSQRPAVFLVYDAGPSF